MMLVEKEGIQKETRHVVMKEYCKTNWAVPHPVKMSPASQALQTLEYWSVMILSTVMQDAQ